MTDFYENCDEISGSIKADNLFFGQLNYHQVFEKNPV
jgi:hypothetical protein